MAFLTRNGKNKKSLLRDKKKKSKTQHVACNIVLQYVKKSLLALKEQKCERVCKSMSQVTASQRE